MKLNRLSIDGLLAVQHLDVELSTPITILAGRNMAGKTSTADAIRVALTGELPRGVRTKEQQQQLINDHASAGSVAVVLDGAEYHRTFPGKDGAVPDLPALPFVLAPQRFAAIDPDARRTFLFALTKCGANSKAVKARMLELGCDEKLVDAVLPLLRSGFPETSEHAKAKALDAKSEWKGLTGETYGEKKAETWKAEAPAFDADRLSAIEEGLRGLETRIGIHTQSLGALREKARAYDADQQARGQRQAQIAKLPNLRTKLATDEEELAKWVAEVAKLEQRAGAAPRVGLVHDLRTALLGYQTLMDRTQGIVDADGAITDWADIKEVDAAEAALVAYIKEFGNSGAADDPEAALRLPEAIASRDLCTRTVANDKRDVAMAEAAAAANETAMPEVVKPDDINTVSSVLDKLKEERTGLQQERQRIAAAQTAAAQADKKTKDAAARHADVLAWLKIADTLSPSGIPAELLGAALAPFNARIAASAAATGWPVPKVEDDMSITARRPYALLSASEQFRVDVLLAEAISHLSGLRLLVVDAFDVLDIPARGELLNWLQDLADAGEIDSAVLLGTLKSIPADDGHIRAHWIDAGEISKSAQLQAA